MKALVLSHTSPISDQLHAQVSFIDQTGAVIDAQDLPLGNFVITGLADIALADQNAILAYAGLQGWIMTSADIMNPASAAYGLQ